MWKRSETEHIFCEVMEVRKDGKIMIKIFKNMKFKNKLIKDASYLLRIPKQEMEEHEKSINYLIALSILESHRGNTNNSIVRQFTTNLIEGLITGEDLKNPPTMHHRMSVIAPGGISDDDDGGNGLADDDQSKNCCRRCWARLTRKSS